MDPAQFQTFTLGLTQQEAERREQLMMRELVKEYNSERHRKMNNLMIWSLIMTALDRALNPCWAIIA